VTDIGDYAFFGCSNLNKVTVHWMNPERIRFGTSVFVEMFPGYTMLRVPNGTRKRYQSLRIWAYFQIV
jgi:hypothetical protein